MKRRETRSHRIRRIYRITEVLYAIPKRKITIVNVKTFLRMLDNLYETP